MDGTFVKELDERFREPVILDNGFVGVPGGWSVSDPAALIKPGPQVEALAVYSLGALRDYLVANRDGLELARLAVHVVSPQLVRLVGPIELRARSREVFVQAKADNLTDGYLGKHMQTDEFIVGLLTRFQLSEDRTKVVQLFSTVTQEAIRISSDDSMTQTVTAKSGIALKVDASVPNPIALIPFRTFREVTQPPSLFALRVAGGNGREVTVGMFEADGGAWRLEAIASIGDWLRKELPAGVAVLA